MRPSRDKPIIICNIAGGIWRAMLSSCVHLTKICLRLRFLKNLSQRGGLQMEIEHIIPFDWPLLYIDASDMSKYINKGIIFGRTWIYIYMAYLANNIDWNVCEDVPWKSHLGGLSDMLIYCCNSIGNISRAVVTWVAMQCHLSGVSDQKKYCRRLAATNSSKALWKSICIWIPPNGSF